MQARCAPGKMRSKLRVSGACALRPHLYGLARSRMETWAPAAAIEIRYEALRAGHGTSKARAPAWLLATKQHAAHGAELEAPRNFGSRATARPVSIHPAVHLQIEAGLLRRCRSSSRYARKAHCRRDRRRGDGRVDARVERLIERGADRSSPHPNGAQNGAQTTQKQQRPASLRA